MAFQITSVSIVCSTVYSGADQISVPLVFVRGLYRWPVDYIHKELVVRKFPFDDVIMEGRFILKTQYHCWWWPGDGRSEDINTHGITWWRHQIEIISVVLALFLRGIYRSQVNSPHKGQWRRALMFSLIRALNKRFSKQVWGWWFETPSRSLWRHCHGSRSPETFQAPYQ